MVYRFLNSCVSLIGLCAVAHSQVTLAQAKAISGGFRLVAAKAGTNSIVGSTPSTDDPDVSETEYPGCYDLDYGDGHTVVRKSDGMIIKFWCRDISDNDLVWNDTAKLSPLRPGALGESPPEVQDLLGLIRWAS